MRFREHPVAVLADIEGIFMQIAIHQIDQSALRFLWLADNQIQQYQFTRLIFGANCSPSCAIYVLNHCAKENIQHFPEALKAARKHFYMDNYIQSHATEKDACKAVLQTKHCLKTGGFRLTKFVSNSSIVLNQIPPEDKENQTDIVRVLGVKWSLVKDCFLMKPLTNFPKDALAYTQRKIFSLVSSIFDPIGIMSPSTIRFKIVLQELRNLGKKWDEQIAPQVVKPLQKNLDLYFSSPEVTLNRSLNKSCHSPESENEIHVFVDASTVAVAAVAYLKTVPNLGTDVETCYLIGKCKVAPIKQISIPKLELEAVVIGVRLLSTIMKESSIHITRSTIWTDSQVVLDWLSTTKKQPAFVANRLKEIFASAGAYQWKHVTTKENPADHGTRGLNPDEIPAKWLTAPAFLSTRQLTTPEKSSKHVLATHELSRNLSEQVIDPTRFSTWNKMLLTLATVFNLVFRIKKQRPKDQQYIREDVILARNRLIKMSQQNFFFSTIQALERGSRIDSKSKTRSLNPMLDNNGILRSCGRLQFAPDNLEVEKFRIILHAKDKIARLYVEHAHKICVHQ